MSAALNQAAPTPANPSATAVTVSLPVPSSSGSNWNRI